MEPIRAPLTVGLIGFGIGGALLLAWWLISQPTGLMFKFMHGLFFGLGMLLGISGGFLALCIGLVYLVYFFRQPRTPAARAAK